MAEGMILKAALLELRRGEGEAAAPARAIIRANLGPSTGVPPWPDSGGDGRGAGGGSGRQALALDARVARSDEDILGTRLDIKV